MRTTSGLKNKAKTDYSFQLFATNLPNNPYNLNISDVKVPSNSLYSKSKYRESICIKSEECNLDPLLSNLGSGGVIEDKLSYYIYIYMIYMNNTFSVTLHLLR